MLILTIEAAKEHVRILCYDSPPLEKAPSPAGEGWGEGDIFNKTSPKPYFPKGEYKKTIY